MKICKTKCLAAGLAAAVALASAASAAGSQRSPGEGPAKLLVGQVEEIDGEQVTLKLEGGRPGQGHGQGMERPGFGQDAEGRQVVPPSQDQQTGPQRRGMPSGIGDPQNGGMSGAMGSLQGGMDRPADGQPPADRKTPPDVPEGESLEIKRSTVTLDLSGAEILVETEPGSTRAGSLEDIGIGDNLMAQIDDRGDVVTATLKSMTALSGEGSGQPGGMPGQSGEGGGQPDGMPGMPGAGGGEVTQGSAATTIDSDGAYTNTMYRSTGDDENALRVNGAAVTLEGITVDKSAGASSDPESGDFYGMNAALLATNSANVTIRNAKITSSAQNGNGVFSYGTGTKVTISDTAITTTADNSGGIQTTGGGTTIASDLTVETSGNSSAAIRSDRGGGTVEVTGGTYTSNGYNSPAVYSTADITVKDAVLTATNSEALVIEGKNSIALENCTVTGNMSDTKGSSSSENVHNVMIYQSMSGDADVGTSEFSMTGGTLTSRNGDLIYVTNTHCVMTLSGVELDDQDADGALLRVTGNSASHGWGRAGSNGAQVEFTAASQVLRGDIVVDSISTLNMKLTDSSSLTGTINIVENAQGGAAVSDNAVVTIGEGCTWNLTDDCTVTSLDNQGTINFNGHTITLASGAVLSK